MPRPLLAALSGIALLSVGSLAAISWATSGGPSVSNGDAAAPEETPLSSRRAGPAAPPPSPALPGPAPLARRSDPRTLPGPGREPPRPAAVDRSLQNGVPAGRRRALASLRREIIAGFAELRRRVAPCALDVGGGGRPPPDRTAPAKGDASFLLALETVDGGVRIVDARLESRGSATDAAIQCARAALNGQTISAPSARRGISWQMSFDL